MLAAINAAGYDDQIDAASTHVFRHTLRTELGARNLDSVFRAEALLPRSQTAKIPTRS